MIGKVIEDSENIVVLAGALVSFPYHRTALYVCAFARACVSEYMRAHACVSMCLRLFDNLCATPAALRVSVSIDR